MALEIFLEQQSPADQVFLRGLLDAYPIIRTHFEKYLSIEPRYRLAQVQQDMQNIARSGPKRYGFEGVDTLHQHSQFMSLHALFEAPEGVDATRAHAMALVHDMTEVIVTDFTPHDGFDRADKKRLEGFAAAVIFAGAPQRAFFTELTQEYAEKKTPTAQWVSDVDKLDPMFMALQLEARSGRGDIFRDFIAYPTSQIQTSRGKEILADIIENADAYRAHYTRLFVQLPLSQPQVRAGWVSQVISKHLSGVLSPKL